MSDFFEKDNLLSVFPTALAGDDNIYALANAVAEELEKLFLQLDYVNLYARIDELDDTLLDILAYDYKIDWWDKSFTLEQKRNTLKTCWSIKRKLGTPQSVTDAISAIYESAEIKEWFEYGGDPFYFRLSANVGELLPDYDKLEKIIKRAEYYKNKRSLIEALSVTARKTAGVYVGVILQGGGVLNLTTDTLSMYDYLYLADENDIVLADESDIVLTNEDEVIALTAKG